MAVDYKILHFEPWLAGISKPETKMVVKSCCLEKNNFSEEEQKPLT